MVTSTTTDKNEYSQMESELVKIIRKINVNYDNIVEMGLKAHKKGNKSLYSQIIALLPPEKREELEALVDEYENKFYADMP